MLVSVIVGLSAISAMAEEQADTVIGPKAASTVEQSEKTETDKDASESVIKPPVEAMLLVRENLI